MRRFLVAAMVLALSAAGIWLLSTFDVRMLWRLSSPVLLLLVVLSLVYSFIYGVGVAWLLRGLGQARPVWRVFLVISGGGTASYLGNVQLGIPLRLFLFDKLLAIPYASGAASVALETACWFGLMGVGLLLAGTASNLAPWVTLVLLVSAIAIGYRVSLPLLRGLRGWLPARIRGRSLQLLHGFLADLEAALAGMRWPWLLATLALFSANYAIDAVSVALVVQQFGEQVALLDALEAVILSYLAGLVSLVPMGLGVRDVSLVVLLERGGVSREVATAVAVVHRGLRTVLPLVIGLVAVNLLGMRALLRQASRAEPTRGG